MINVIDMHSKCPEISVEVTETGQEPMNGWVACEIEKNIQFNPKALQSYFFSNWEPVIYDLLLLTAAVEFVDRYKPRKNKIWPRILNLLVPVHELERWNNEGLKLELQATLNVLTGDQWSIDFKSRCSKDYEPPQSLLELSKEYEASMAFSDGLDSLCVSEIHKAEHGKDSLVRVRVGNNKNNIGGQEPFTVIPFNIYGGKREPSNRSRGFKFNAISGLAAYLCGAKKVIAPESGQGALGPVLAPLHSVYPDLRNHPRFHQKMRSFIYRLLGYEVKYKIPRIWHTKGETVLAALSVGVSEESLKLTRSCWKKRDNVAFDGKRNQCGLCAACMLRRLSFHTAGIQENNNTYSWENLNAENFIDAARPEFRDKPLKQMRRYAVAGVQHLENLARLAGSSVRQREVESYANDIALALGEKDSRKVFEMMNGMLQKHAEEWRSFVDTLNQRSFVRKWSER